MRCACGALIRASMKRCRKCAVEFVRNIDTDSIILQAARKDKRVAVRPKRDDPNRGGVHRMPDWTERDHRKRQLKLIIGIIVIVVLLVALAFLLCLV